MRIELSILLASLTLVACERDDEQAEPEQVAPPVAEEPAKREVDPLVQAVERCKAGPDCAGAGLCDAKPGADGAFVCVASSDAHCQASRECAQTAACSLAAPTGTCVAKDDDCLFTDRCRQDGRCHLLPGPDGAPHCSFESKDHIDFTGRRRVTTVGYHTSQAKLEGDVDRDFLRRIIRAHSPDLHECDRKARKKGSKLDGVIIIGWTIDLEGKSTNVRIVEDNLESPIVGECLVARIEKSWKFVAPQDGNEARVTVPFSFAWGDPDKLE